MTTALEWVPLSWAEIIIVISVFAIASALQGTVGFGSTVIAGPFLVLIEPRFVPGPVLLAGLLITVLILRRDGFHAELSDVIRLNLARVFGSAIGAAALLRLSPSGVSLVLSVLMLTAVAFSAAGVTVVPTRRTIVMTGVLSGIAGTVAGLAGAATALLFQNERGVRLRGNLSAFLLPGSIISIGFVAAVGRLRSLELRLFIILTPAVLLGHLLSTRFSKRLDRWVSRQAILTVAAIAAVWVLVRVTWQWASNR